MCEPTTIAIAGTALAAVGAYTSYEGGQQAISASKNAQDAAFASQNEAFNTRMQAQQQQLQEETAANTASASRFQAIQDNQQQAQLDAINQRGAATQAINTQEAAVADQANQAVNKATQATTAPALAGAQAGQLAQQQALNVPAQDNIQASNPLGNLNTGETAKAMAASTAGAEKYTQQYGDNLARLSSYSAPIELAGNEATTLGTNLMPAATADQLIKTGAPAILAPSSLAYTQAGDYGASRQAANELQTKSALDLANTRDQNAIDLANLQQGDTAASIQGALNIAQARAAQQVSLGQGLTSIGTTGLTLAGSQGAFSSKGPLTLTRTNFNV